MEHGRAREPQTSLGAFISKQALVKEKKKRRQSAGSGRNTRDHRCICPPAPAVRSVCAPLAAFVRPWLSYCQLTSVREATGDWERVATRGRNPGITGKGGRSSPQLPEQTADADPNFEKFFFLESSLPNMLKTHICLLDSLKMCSMLKGPQGRFF